MKIVRILCEIVLFAVLAQGLIAQHRHDIGDSNEEPKSEKTNLIDEFGRLGHCDLTSRFDFLFQELSKQTTAHGYLIFYKAADALPGSDIASHERLFREHLAFRNFSAEQITIVDGGYRSGMETEIWLVQPGGDIPEPSKTVPAPKMPLAKTFLFDKRSVLLDDSGTLLQEFELPSVKAAREAEEAKWEAEQKALDAELEAEKAEPDAQSAPETAVATEAEVEEEAAEEYVDKRTPEEIEAERFEWVSDRLGQLLATEKKASGVIIFYADDETLDIAKLGRFIEQGRKRMADAAGIPIKRIRVEFGGYRGIVESEFWYVPAKGKKPQATPEERSVEVPEESET